MNRLILIGNGFDLAHGMKTGYNDFMLYYIKDCFKQAVAKTEYEDYFLKINIPRTSLFNDHFATISERIDQCYQYNQLGNLVAGKLVRLENGYEYHTGAKVVCKSTLFKRLAENCSKINWVEIENEFYAHLKKLLEENRESIIKEQLAELNASMQYLIECLTRYLWSLKPEKHNNEYTQIFYQQFRGLDNPMQINSRSIRQTMILNFNYTSTPEYYMQQTPMGTQTDTINYIHGKLNDPDNPVIFGFGDELDKDYMRMEDSKIKGYFRYIKSFWYFKTRNYHDLIRFIDGEDFQVFIMGHSCGLSDRTMLNMIFEHNNCKSIKIFYYAWEGGNNYTELTEEISRHFKNKADMRRKIVPFCNSQPMPQVL